MPLLPQKMLYVRLADTCSSHVYYTSPWRLTRGVSTRLRLFASCNHYTLKSMKDNRKSMAMGHTGLCLRWRQFQLRGSWMMMIDQLGDMTGWASWAYSAYRLLQCWNFAAYSSGLSPLSSKWYYLRREQCSALLTCPRVPISGASYPSAQFSQRQILKRVRKQWNPSTIRRGSNHNSDSLWYVSKPTLKVSWSTSQPKQQNCSVV
jgi:hypothetical protein